MAVASRIGVVYATESKILRRIIGPDTEEELDDGRHLGLGESMLILAGLAGPYTRQNIAQAVLSQTGTLPPSGRCCVVDGSGVVVSVINADPVLDSIPDHVLVLSDEAQVGWTYKDGELAGTISLPRRRTIGLLPTVTPPKA